MKRLLFIVVLKIFFAGNLFSSGATQFSGNLFRPVENTPHSYDLGPSNDPPSATYYSNEISLSGSNEHADNLFVKVFESFLTDDPALRIPPDPEDTDGGGPQKIAPGGELTCEIALILFFLFYFFKRFNISNLQRIQERADKTNE